MNDKELADAVVALGVHRYRVAEHVGIYDPPMSREQTDEEFLSDWRVAGALMEKCNNVRWCRLTIDGFQALAEYGEPERINNIASANNESLPRAIIEACVEALNVELA